MNDKLVQLQIPADFVVTRVLPTAAELAYGFRHGFLSPDDVIAVALAKYTAEIPLGPVEEQLALLLSDQRDKVDELVGALEPADPTERPDRVWLYLALAWLLEHADEFDDPLHVIELVYADFEYPEEIRSLVRFLPPEPGEAPGVDGLWKRWRQWVEQAGAEYAARDSG